MTADATLAATGAGHFVEQPYRYAKVELVEPDWTRLPGWADASVEEWESVQWQRSHCVKNVRQLREVLGPGVDEAFLADLERDQAERATMSMLLPPQMVNTMVPHLAPGEPGRSPGTIVFTICGGTSIDIVARSAWSRSRSA